MSDNEEEQNNEEPTEIFNTYQEDRTLNREIGIQKALDSFLGMDLGVPETCTTNDLYFLIQQSAPEDNFTLKTYVEFYNNAYNTILDTLGVSPEEEDAFDLTKDFVTERLSDLQQMSENDFNFQFTSFVVTNASIGKIDILPEFKYLKNIELKTNLIMDIAPLQQLENLVSINVTENRIASIDGFEFKSLEKLNLEGNQICYLNKLVAPKLKVLNLSKNRIFFISPNSLAECPALEELDLSTNAIRSLKEGALSGLKNLKTYKIDTNNLESLENVICDDMTEITDIDISSNQITDISAIAKLTKLEVLDTHALPIETVDPYIPLQNLEKLLYLYIYETPFADSRNARIELIHYLQHLEEIDETAITFDEKENSEAFFNEGGEDQQAVYEEEEKYEGEADQEAEEQ